MEPARTLFTDLAILFPVAAVVSLLFQRVRQPVVLGYLLVGLIIGPHVPIPLFADPHRVETLAELGVVLVMFSIGLEFSVARLMRLLPTAGIIGLIQMTAMLTVGYSLGRVAGWDWRESLFLGAGVSVSSTMIVARVLDEEKVEGSLRETVFGILVVQDIGAILMITLLTAVAGGAGLPLGEVAWTVGRLGLFLVGTMAVGMLIVPRAIRSAAHHAQTETLLVVAIGTCFGLSLLAEHLGYSVALGAFVGGSLVAESGRSHAVEHLIAPVRDLFAAVFFVSIGMLVDPAAILDNLGIIIALTAVVLVGQPLFVAIGGFLATGSVRNSVRAGMSLAQIGEFSFIIASVGVSAGVVSPRLYAVCVAVAAITAFTTPLMVGGSERVALGIERRLPHRLQHFASLYAGWLAQMRTRPARRGAARTLWAWLTLDLALLMAVLMGASASRAWLAEVLGGPAWLSSAVAFGTAAILGAPFAIGVVRLARRLGQNLARRALPPRDGLDLAAIPRRAFVLALQLGILVGVGLPLVAFSHLFLPIFVGAGLLLVTLVVLGIMLWRSTSELESHMRAGAEAVLEVLASQRAEETPLAKLDSLLPGLPMVSHRVAEGSPAVGQTLAFLNLRGLTGANVVAIERAADNVVVPTGHESLQAGDLLALAGAPSAVEAAKCLLDTGQLARPVVAVAGEVAG